MAEPLPVAARVTPGAVPRVTVAGVVAASVRRAILESTNELTPVVLQVLGLGMALLSQAFLGRLVDASPNAKLGSYAGHFAAFLLLGAAVLDLQTSVVRGLAYRIRQAQMEGSLEGMLATPTPVALLLLALALPEVLFAVARLALYGFFGWLLFGVRFGAVSGMGVLLVLIASVAAFSAFALVGAALTMLLRRADPMNLLLAAASAIAGGVFYPRGILPAWLEQLGGLLPIAPTLDGLRAAVVLGSGPLELGGPLLRLGLTVALVGPLGAWLFARMLARARIDGSLTSY
jgi:ABC-2 type transport system permease protein